MLNLLKDSSQLRVLGLAALLVILFLSQILMAVHREVMTTDEGYHTYAGYRYWQCGDYGVNPEHPPFAKLVAALPLVLSHVAAPAGSCPVTSTNKFAGYGDSRSWYYGSPGAPPKIDVDTVIWHARLAMSSFALVLGLVVFFFTRRMYGDWAALAALALVAFEPTLIAHGALVTTDMALSAMSLLAVFSFFLYWRRPGPLRLALAGLTCGLTLAVKHSGILIVPVLCVLCAAEIVVLLKGKSAQKKKLILRQVGALAVVFAIALGTLWTVYLFRYSARPAGAELTMPLSSFIADTTAQGNQSILLKMIPTAARYHLLPEAYLYGLVDVLSISDPGQSSYLFGHLYPHGVPQYFPSVILIKTTLGMLGLGFLVTVAAFRRQIRIDLRAVYLLIPAAVWMAAGMVSTLNIGYRHVLPIVAPACCLIGAGMVALWRRNHRVVGAAFVVLLVAHAASSLASFPNEIAYGNEAFGGVANNFRLLTDSNNDWGQALPQLADWLHDHKAEDCWFAYDGMADPKHSGINCRYLLQNGFGAAGPPPPATLTGTVVISGLSLSGIEWERADLNPYENFRKAKPVAVVGGADIIYQGTFDMTRLVAVHQSVQAMRLNEDKHFGEALPMAQAAVGTLPTSGFAHLQLAHALKGLGHRAEAHAEYLQAKAIADAQPEWYFLQKPGIEEGVHETR